MCGIAGIYNRSGKAVAETEIRGMCQKLKHRGPDQHGLWSKGPVALGHQRLSIIDLSEHGRNPIPNEDETVWLVCNGEIYNYKEIRRDLESKGHQFRSNTDTEVILHLYEEKGIDCVKDLNGMFAFAIWDDHKQELHLARDRFGVKPLYYTELGPRVAIASEIKAFLDLSDFTVKPNLKALSEHLTFQNTLDNKTFFENVWMLEAGTVITFSKSDVSKNQYWDMEFDPDETLSLEEWSRGLRERFEASVRRQMVSDVPIGAFLSGGMDTGTIAAVAARQIEGMHTFTCGFNLPQSVTSMEQYFDESKESHELAALLGTRHHEIKLGPEAMAPVFPQVVWHLDEPRVGISYQYYYTSQMIQKHVKVVLSGTGGDELFGGYPWRYEPLLETKESEFESVYFRLWTRFMNDEAKQTFFTHDVCKQISGYSSRDVFNEVLNSAKADDLLHRALHFDFKTFLHGLLVVDDKLSMAHSVEARVPFLDNDLVDYVSRMPSSMKLSKGSSKTVLRRAMKGLVPDETLTRRKQGFTPPDQSWYKGPNRRYVEDMVIGKRALDRGYFEPNALRGMLDDHFNDRHNNRFLIWSLMSFEWWNRLFVDRDALEVDQVAASQTVI